MLFYAVGLLPCSSPLQWVGLHALVAVQLPLLLWLQLPPLFVPHSNCRLALVLPGCDSTRPPRSLGLRRVCGHAELVDLVGAVDLVTAFAVLLRSSLISPPQQTVAAPASAVPATPAAAPAAAATTALANRHSTGPLLLPPPLQLLPPLLLLLLLLLLLQLLPLLLPPLPLLLRQQRRPSSHSPTDNATG